MAFKATAQEDETALAVSPQGAIAPANDFDFEDFAKYKRPPSRQPAIKVINVESPVGLWVAADNMELAGWNPEGDMSSVGAIPHKVKTKDIASDGKGFVYIDGFLITKPRIVVINESPLLGCLINDPDPKKKEKINKEFTGVWEKDYEFPAGYTKTTHSYKAITMYLLWLLDANNQPLHSVPLQLSARGNFAVEFAKQMKRFRGEFEQVFLEMKGHIKLDKNPEMDNRWHTMSVFCPIFETQIRGDDGLASPCCITTGYETPTVENFNQLCIAYGELKDTAIALHDRTQDFWHKVFKNRPIAKAPNAATVARAMGIDEAEKRLSRISHKLSIPMSKIRQDVWDMYGKTLTQISEQECLQAESFYLSAYDNIPF